MGEPCLGIEREWEKKNAEGNEKKGYVCERLWRSERKLRAFNNVKCWVRRGVAYRLSEPL